LPDEKLPKEIIHSYVLSGITSQYKFNEKIKLYGGWSQAYRPVIFADIIPGSPIELVNENMLDAKGSNAELGIKAKSGKRLQMDLTYFKVEYNNRIGNMIIKDENGNSSIYKTNIGDSRTQGIEVLVNYRIVESAKSLVSIFTSTSYMHGKYKKGSLRLGNENIDITNHLLETTPKWISRNGLNVGYKRFNSTLLFSYVSDSYSDALNTEMPTTNGAAGIVPEYNVLDFNFSYTINKHLNIKCNLNNMTNAQYFTKRPTGYPGVGVWSSDGRNMTVSISVKL
jgi:Fe(3+) dicitrate transport protein